MTTNQLKISLELLYHYNCPACNKWWSVRDLRPVPGQLVWCPHCTTQHQVPDEVLLGDGSSIPLQALANEMNQFAGDLALTINELTTAFPQCLTNAIDEPLKSSSERDADTQP